MSSNPIYGHGANPLKVNMKAAQYFWNILPVGDGIKRMGKCEVYRTPSGNMIMRYYNNSIACLSEDGTLMLATCGHNTMTTRRYLGAVLLPIGWSIVALNGKSVAIKGVAKYPNKKNLDKLIEEENAVIIGDLWTDIPELALIGDRYTAVWTREGGRKLTDRRSNRSVYLQTGDDANALGTAPSQAAISAYF